MKKFVKVNDTATAREFGCTIEHFDRHIKGKSLLVITEYKEISLVQDETEEQYTVSKEDLVNGSEVAHA